jgi:hypothetical protein
LQQAYRVSYFPFVILLLADHFLFIDLETLDLTHTTIFPLRPAASLPRLRNLTLRNLLLDDTIINEVPAARQLPQLRTFVLSTTGEGEDDRAFYNSISVELAQQLDALQLHGEKRSALSAAVLTLPVPILITLDDYDVCEESVTFSSAPRHLRFYFRPRYSLPRPIALYLHKLRKLVDVPIPPTSLHLPTSFLEDRYPDADELATASSTLLTTCATRRIEVLWYDPDEEENYALSPSFCRYAKRFKAEEPLRTMNRL